MIFLDIETSGIDRINCSILSIGAVDYETGLSFYTECRRQDEFSIADEALKINGFTRERIKAITKSDREGYFEFEAWTKQFNNPILAGYHIGGFDCMFLHKAFDGTFDMNWPFGKRFVDLHSIAYYLFDESLSLDKLLARLNMPPEAKPHNALTGAQLECAIYKTLKNT